MSTSRKYLFGSIFHSVSPIYAQSRYQMMILCKNVDFAIFLYQLPKLGFWRLDLGMGLVSLERSQYTLQESTGFFRSSMLLVMFYQVLGVLVIWVYFTRFDSNLGLRAVFLKRILFSSIQAQISSNRVVRS